jgi:hypothetical protein
MDFARGEHDHSAAGQRLRRQRGKEHATGRYQLGSVPKIASCSSESLYGFKAPAATARSYLARASSSVAAGHSSSAFSSVITSASSYLSRPAEAYGWCGFAVCPIFPPS